MHTAIFEIDNQQDLRIAQGTQLSVMWQPGWEGSLGRMDPCMCVDEPLCCSPEMIPTLVISYAAAAAAKSLQSCPTLCDPIDGSHQAPLSLGFSRQEYWSGLPFPSPIYTPIQNKYCKRDNTCNFTKQSKWLLISGCISF